MAKEKIRLEDKLKIDVSKWEDLDVDTILKRATTIKEILPFIPKELFEDNSGYTIINCYSKSHEKCDDKDGRVYNQIERIFMEIKMSHGGRIKIPKDISDSFIHYSQNNLEMNFKLKGISYSINYKFE